MGTSLLEFAKLKIPAVMVDIMPNKIPVYDNKFNWLSDSTRFSMGDLYSEDITHRHTLFEMI